MSIGKDAGVVDSTVVPRVVTSVRGKSTDDECQVAGSGDVSLVVDTLSDEYSVLRMLTGLMGQLGSQPARSPQWLDTFEQIKSVNDHMQHLHASLTVRAHGGRFIDEHPTVGCSALDGALGNVPPRRAWESTLSTTPQWSSMRMGA